VSHQEQKPLKRFNLFGRRKSTSPKRGVNEKAPSAEGLNNAEKDGFAAHCANKSNHERDRSADFPVRSNIRVPQRVRNFCNPPLILPCCGLESPRSDGWRVWTDVRLRADGCGLSGDMGFE